MVLILNFEQLLIFNEKNKWADADYSLVQDRNGYGNLCRQSVIEFGFDIHVIDFGFDVPICKNVTF